MGNTCRVSWTSLGNVNCRTIVPQLSKCLKFEAVWGVLTDQMIWIWTKRYNKTHACIIVHRMARYNHLIDWYYLRSSFVQLHCNGDRKSQKLHLSTCIQLRMTKHPSRKVMNFRHLLGCDTIGPIQWLRQRPYSITPLTRTLNLAIWLLLFKQRRMQFKPIKIRLFC